MEAVAKANNQQLITTAADKRTATHQRKADKAEAAAMVALQSPAYVRRDEDRLHQWVLVSPVLDPDADVDEAAYFVKTPKHCQPDLRPATLMSYFQFIKGPLTLDRLPPKGTRLEDRDVGRIMVIWP